MSYSDLHRRDFSRLTLAAFGGLMTGATARLMAQPPNPLIAGSLALLGIGLLLFGLRLASTRVR